MRLAKKRLFILSLLIGTGIGLWCVAINTSPQEVGTASVNVEGVQSPAGVELDLPKAAATLPTAAVAPLAGEPRIEPPPVHSHGSGNDEPVDRFNQAESSEPSAAAIDDYTANQVALLNAAVDEGVRDSWSRVTENELATSLQTMVAANAALGAVDNVVCSQQACRARLTPADPSDPQALLASLSAALDWSGERYFELDVNEPPQLSVFALREGFHRSTAPSERQ